MRTTLHCLYSPAMPQFERMNKPPYIGRYAPSPTGDLHLGNLRTALLAWLHARLHGGQFLLRMEDLDLPRVVVGSADSILRDLERLGIDWDSQVVYQSTRQEAYADALVQLDEMGLVYSCFCSRKDIQLAASAPHSKTSVYPGTCRGLSAAEVMQRAQQKKPAVRVKVTGQEIVYHDQIVGARSEYLADSCGDFVVRRADEIYAYQLAVLVDDLDQRVTNVVRGADLASSTARQVFLAQLLASEQSAIRYAHVPLMLDASQQRMSKRDGSDSLEHWSAQGNSAEELVGAFAYQLGLVKKQRALSARELLQSLNIDQLEAALADV